MPLAYKKPIFTINTSDPSTKNIILTLWVSSVLLLLPAKRALELEFYYGLYWLITFSFTNKYLTELFLLTCNLPTNKNCDLSIVICPHLTFPKGKGYKEN